MHKSAGKVAQANRQASSADTVLARPAGVLPLSQDAVLLRTGAEDFNFGM